MPCEHWTEKLDAYLDGELPVEEARALNEHLRQCANCAAEGLRRVQLKRAVQAAAQQFAPDPAFRARIQTKISSRQPTPRSRRWLPVLVAATAVLALIASFLFTFQRTRTIEQQLSELIDQHVATLASSNPVDVISSDRHTVKPWFQGKIPFTFNLPDLQGSPFVLVGGKVSYIRQSPGAELLFRIRQHQVSVFIFQERSISDDGASQAVRTTLSFQVRSWRRNGLRYFVVGDASPSDLDQLSELIMAAG